MTDKQVVLLNLTYAGSNTINVAVYADAEQLEADVANLTTGYKRGGLIATNSAKRHVRQYYKHMPIPGHGEYIQTLIIETVTLAFHEEEEYHE